MKQLVSFAVLLLVACSALAEPRSWSFVQSVGGIAVDQPIQKDGAWLLPVISDVSGLQAITVKPSQLNSGLACQAVESTVEGASIFIVIATTIAGSGRTAQCPPAALGSPAPGIYSVFYRGPNGAPVLLREVRIGAQPTVQADGPAFGESAA